MKNRNQGISIIDKDLTLDGTVSGRGRLIVNGTLKGTLNAEVVDIAASGAVYADAQTAHMEIAGCFEGNLKVGGKLVIHAGGSCSGSVECSDLEVAAGGKLNADIVCVKDGDAKSQKKVTFFRKKG